MDNLKQNLSLWDIFQEYFPLCIWRHDPLDLHPSSIFFKFNLVIYYCVELFMQANMIDPWEAFWEVNLETLFTLGFVALMMMINRNFDRYLQVATSFLICENIIAVVAIPVMIWLTVTDDLWSYITFGILVFWDVTLVTYIIKKVLKINVFASLAVAFIYFACTYGGAYGLMLLI
ncbi:MAG: hypothetical protein GQ569_06315 [Methylococcaceae bacterium]|nr:hypothetical protein [Methylococcaceae bacterium]